MAKLDREITEIDEKLSETTCLYRDSKKEEGDRSASSLLSLIEAKILESEKKTDLLQQRLAVHHIRISIS